MPLLCLHIRKSESLEGRVALLRFDGVLYVCCGHPNDEALAGHPLAKYGLQHYEFFEVGDSPLIAEIEERNKVHRLHRSGMYSSRFKHWIVTFHDETLEVVATGATVIGVSALSPDQALTVVFEAKEES
ncbi:MAG TPA: hypothetical protein VLK33_09470 [Terriglobales bacterium]|nr:hypothetical protein [Terriglobales bacterium]